MERHESESIEQPRDHSSSDNVQQYNSIEINIANKNEKGYIGMSHSNNLDLFHNYKPYDGSTGTKKAVSTGWIRIISDQREILK